MYNFKREDAFDFARFIGARAKEVNRQLVFRNCPYCRGAGDNANTFSISLETGQFECKRAKCRAKGNMLTLSRDFDYSISDEIDRYIDRGGINQKFRTYDLPSIVLSKDAAVRHLYKRGISEEICKKYEITVQRDNEDILVFIFRDEHGTVQTIKYRNAAFVKGETKGSKEWFEPNSKQILFGMNHCEGFDSLVVTEGQMDSLSLAEAGIKNAVSVPGGCKSSTFLPFCWDWLIKFKSITIFGDCENGGITLTDMFARLPVEIRIVQEADYKGCKDANEILQKFGKEALVEAVKNAKGKAPVGIKKLSEVKRVKLLEQDSILTGIQPLDSKLTKGLFCGQVVLLSGKRGDGKSAFLTQIACNAIDQGIRTFLYSGELTDFNVRNWADTIFAGCHEREITSEDAQKISSWYEDRFFLYDSNVIDADEHASLLEIATQAIIQYDCKLILIDNLMTVVEADSNDGLYRQQSQFVGKLAKIAKLYNVVIVLVAHPRKGMIGQNEFQNDDVSGSSDITNKVDVVMYYNRIKPKKDEPERPDLRAVTITKNRLTGALALGDNAILVKYDNNSRRIVGINESFNRHFGWQADKDQFVPNQEELPFMEE